MPETIEHDNTRSDVLKLFSPPLLTPSPDCPRCQEYARRRDTPTGPLHGTVVTDMQVLMKRCAKAGHR
ncbi:hypothetical protein ACFWJT_34835 [Streptomyces sp. NPDC127069]|uniref:hypothetical protein n=1 Tax=Streptomyces sp. NPDC127069 TaxID=3347128 RepID=UPI00365D46CE